MFLNKAAPHFSTHLKLDDNISVARRIQATRGANSSCTSHGGSKEGCTSNKESHLDEVTHRGALLAGGGG